MHINIKTTGSVNLTDELRAYVEDKFKKIEKIVDPNDTVIMADVELATITEGQQTGNIYRAEINVTHKGGLTRAEAIRDTMHGAIDMAVKESRRELRKEFSRHRQFVRRGASKVKDFLRGFGENRD